jgi:hypothetical protein
LPIPLDRVVSGGIKVGIQVGISGEQTRQQLVVQVRLSLGYHVDEDEADPLLQIRLALGDEGIPLGRSVLVRRAHQFDRTCQGGAFIYY